MTSFQIMSGQPLKQRDTAMGDLGRDPEVVGKEKGAEDKHPAGEIKHGQLVQILRAVLFAAYFLSCSCR